MDNGETRKLHYGSRGGKTDLLPEIIEYVISKSIRKFVVNKISLNHNFLL